MRGVMAAARDSQKPPSAESMVADEARHHLHSVLENAPLILWVIDRDGRITLSVGRGLRALGLEPQQNVGRSIFEAYPDPEIQRAMRRGLAGEEFTHSSEVQGVAFETRYCPLRNESGEVTGLLGVSLDVSARLNAEREREAMHTQLLQAQKLESLGLLAGGIAHDFNNILTAILGSASAAQATVPPEHPARRDLDNVVLSARRAADLTRQMLAYSGRGNFEIRPVCLSTLVREIATLLESAISKKVEVRLRLAERLPAVEADVSQLQQVLMNLVINGAEAIGDRAGTVSIRTGVQRVGRAYAEQLRAVNEIEAGTYVFVEVNDSGCGMDADTLARIFDPFFSTKFAGRGLGLAAVLGIVRGHGGSLEVDSAPGGGTTFKVLLPASSAAPSSAARVSHEFRGEGLVLIVDDDEGVRRAATRMLQHFGFEVIQACDGQEGVDFFAQRSAEIVLVLLDLTMPRLSGEEAFREMRRLRADVPVILTSGYSEDEATRSFAASGPSGFVQKPFGLSDLAAKLHGVLGAGRPTAG
jgi:two-component system, cell cycle sensor histidine kinase and response regulator CckA